MGRSATLAVAFTWTLALAPPAQDEATEGRPVDPRAEATVLDWIETPRGFTEGIFEVVDSMDQVTEWGQKILTTHRRTLTVRRPNRLRVESRGDLLNRDLIYDGSTVSVYDHDLDAYAQVDFEGTIGEMIDMLEERHSLTTPLADLLHEDRSAILEGVVTGHYLGESSVNGHPCHHVAFTREDIDWQGWFDSEDRTRLWRYLVTFKGEPQAPQYTATLLSVEFPESLPTDAFEFVVPEGAERIDLAAASPEVTGEAPVD